MNKLKENAIDIRKDENAVSHVFGILLMVAIIIILAASVLIYSFELGNNKLKDNDYSRGMVVDTVYKIQYNQDGVHIFLMNYGNDSITYRVSNKEKRMIRKLEDSYKNQIPVEVHYVRIGWLYQISDVEY